MNLWESDEKHLFVKTFIIFHNNSRISKTIHLFSSNQTQKCFSVVFYFIEKINRSNMSSYEVEDRALVCPYCFNTLTNPLILSCGHNLCEECVLRMRRGGETSRETKRRLNEEGECEEV